jgi:acetyl-CoA synthetase
MTKTLGTMAYMIQEMYHTYKDEEGCIWFVGRSDDIIKSSSYRVGHYEVESALMEHPCVLECAITGVPDEIRETRN